MEIGKYLSLEAFCTCSQTYQKYQDKINPYPQSSESITAIKNLNTYIIDPIIDHFGLENFRLTYGFCSTNLKHFLTKKIRRQDEETVALTPYAISTWPMNLIVIRITIVNG